jgi:hypothetical protein
LLIGRRRGLFRALLEFRLSFYFCSPALDIPDTQESWRQSHLRHTRLQNWGWALLLLLLLGRSAI